MKTLQFPAARQRASAVMLAAVLAVSCATYERAPLDAAALQKSIDARSAPAAPMAALALTEAERLCLLYNPELRAARLRARIPAVGAEHAGAWADPVLSAEFLRILDGGPQPNITGASLAFTIPISGRLAVAKSLAKAEARAAAIAAWGEEQRTLHALRRAWARWQAAAAHRAAAEEHIARLGKTADSAEKLRAAGEISTAEAAAYAIALREAELGVSEAAAEEAAARWHAVELLGLAADTALAQAADEPPAIPDSPPALAVAAERHPDALLRRAEYDVAEERLRLAIREQYPDIEIGPLFGREDGSDRAGIGISMPIPLLNANRRAIAEARAARDAARAAWEAAAAAAVPRAASARAAAQHAAERERIAATELVPKAARQADDVARLLQAGEAETLLMLEALDALRRARTAHADATRARHEAIADFRAILTAEPESAR